MRRVSRLTSLSNAAARQRREHGPSKRSGESQRVARKTHTLCGFSPELDWRPTAFVGPIPPSKLCARCGVIPASGLLLPCGELVCLACRENNGTSCPSHGKMFAESELEVATFSAQHIMQRKASTGDVDIVVLKADIKM
ncbi:hypothetical protein HPB50_004258 [Hyalomma asiaticum]|uniref:Uncharacterized protein n=1 Tax=Hyalomma asiaticum TaxID=266040 RepID=A0ACB7TGW6_HYAAI|nr:hypothetical protein HPB50_004258 [Hyalomma asiaticum]